MIQSYYPFLAFDQASATQWQNGLTMKRILLVLTHGNERTMQDQNHNSDANFVGEKTAAQSVPDEKRSSKLLQDPLSQNNLDICWSREPDQWYEPRSSSPDRLARICDIP